MEIGGYSVQNIPTVGRIRSTHVFSPVLVRFRNAGIPSNQAVLFVGMMDTDKAQQVQFDHLAGVGIPA